MARDARRGSHICLRSAMQQRPIGANKIVFLLVLKLISLICETNQNGVIRYFIWLEERLPILQPLGNTQNSVGRRTLGAGIRNMRANFSFDVIQPED